MKVDSRQAATTPTKTEPKLAAKPAAGPAAAPKPPKPTPAIAKDAVAVRLPSHDDDAPAPKAPAPEEHKGFLTHVKDYMLGNTENKLFMVKFNSLHFKEKIVAGIHALEQGPAAKVIGGIKHMVGHLSAFKGAVAAKFAAAGSEAGVVSKVLGHVGKVGGIAFRAFEKLGPLFGWLVAGQDAVKAVKSYQDPKATGARRGLLTAMAGFSVVGALASTVALSAAAVAAVGLSAPVLGGIAIGCFAGSLVTGWLASKQDKKQGEAA